MKRITSLYALLLSSIIGLAQNAPVNFETGGYGATWTWTVFENDDNPALEILDNPDKTGANTSDKVAKFTARKTGQPWAGCETKHGQDIGSFTLTSATSTIKIMVWKSVISDVGIKLVDASSASLGEIKVANTKTNQWEELTFDFSTREGIPYDQIVIFPDFNARAAETITYFDNIVFGSSTSTGTPLTAAPTPTVAAANVISLFSEAYTNKTVNTWRTDWSAATYSEIEINGNKTIKYANLDFVGIETTGDNLVNASDMDKVHLDMWTPNATTFRIKLVDFGADAAYAGGDDSEHEIVFTSPAKETWNSLVIPFSDFTNLKSRSHLAQIIFSALPAGSSTVYIDNLYFSKNSSARVTNHTGVDVSVYPNPSDGQLNIALNGNQHINFIELIDGAGKAVYTETVNAVAYAKTLSTTALDAGVYVLKVQTAHGVINKKVIIN